MFVHNMYSTNIKGSKKIWIPKIEKLNYDGDDDTDIWSSSYTTKEINMFYFYTSKRGEIYFIIKTRQTYWMLP